MPSAVNTLVNEMYPANWVLRTSRDPLGTVTMIRETVKTVDPDQPIANIRTMAQLLSKSVARQQFNMFLLALFSLVALCLAAIGIYGTIAYSVSQRTHEIGVRMALGAAQRSVVGLVVRQGMSLALAGLAIGLMASFGLTRLMASLLFGVSATDPATFASVALALSVVALVACLVPARRASKVNPIIALRYE